MGIYRLSDEPNWSAKYSKPPAVAVDRINLRVSQDPSALEALALVTAWSSAIMALLGNQSIAVASMEALIRIKPRRAVC
jgi:hypothetical protein